MRKTTGIFLTAIAIISCFITRAQDRTAVHVTFLMHSAELSENSTVYITGGNDQLGNWDPGKVKMQFRGDHTWKKKIRVEGPVSVEYKYTLGSWDREGADKDGSTLPDFHAMLSKDTVIFNSIISWTDKKPVTVKPSVTGTVMYFRGLKGEGLKERDLAVWLPPGYRDDTAARYPVIYLQDGQNVFDAATSAYGTEWRADETLDSLIRIRAIPPVIAVGIYNTPDRSGEYQPGVKGNAYMAFIVNRLKPFIDSAFRTQRGPGQTLVCGASSGGTIAFMLAWEYPSVFSMPLCMSPAFQFDEMDYVKVVRAYTGQKKNLRIYIYNGGIGLETKLQPGIDHMMVALERQGYIEGRDLLFVSDPSQKHFESAWGKWLPRAMVWCLGGK